MSQLPAEPPFAGGQSSIHEMIVAQAFLSPVAVLAPALTKASSGRADEEPRPFAVGSHDERPAGLSSVHVRVGHDDEEES
jgi:hypothetical protein